tara:strand:- start:39934 stop:40590 length:657 start_codon:yes stop_codon:yes gene_type:complete
MERYVAYFRVSTASQGRSGLGLASQRTRIAEFVNPDDEIISEFVEVQSGKTDCRVELWNAINYAKKNSAKILIAKLDRFSRKVSFIARIMDQGIGLVVAEMPNASDFQLHIFAALAQEERRLISERTKSALAEAKKRGVKLGAHGKILSKQNKAEACAYVRSIAPRIKPLIDSGMSFSAIANQLNSSDISSAKGGRFFPQTIKNIAIRLNELESANVS